MLNGKVVYRNGYGEAQLEYGIPITPSTVFHAASLSKQFTAFAILLLEQRKKLSLDDDVITKEQILRMFCRQKALNFTPGDEHLYCNSGYTLLASWGNIRLSFYMDTEGKVMHLMFKAQGRDMKAPRISSKEPSRSSASISAVDACASSPSPRSRRIDRSN